MNKYFKVSFYFNGGLRASYYAQFDDLAAASAAIKQAYQQQTLVTVAGGAIDAGKALGFDVVPANTVAPDKDLLWDMV